MLNDAECKGLVLLFFCIHISHKLLHPIIAQLEFLHLSYCGMAIGLGKTIHIIPDHPYAQGGVHEGSSQPKTQTNRQSNAGKCTLHYVSRLCSWYWWSAKYILCDNILYRVYVLSGLLVVRKNPTAFWYPFRAELKTSFVMQKQVLTLPLQYCQTWLHSLLTLNSMMMTAALHVSYDFVRHVSNMTLCQTFGVIGRPFHKQSFC